MMGIRDWFRRRDEQERKPLGGWFRVSWDAEGVTLDVAPPGREAWVAEFRWDSISRVCFKAEGLEASDGIYVFTALRPESYAIPTEAAGGQEFWNELIRRGLFDAELAIEAASSPEGFFCWPRSTAAHDFSTPEGAILKLEDAYRARDIEAAVACKDFQREAEMMLARLAAGEPSRLAMNAQFIEETAKVLELAFRKQIQDGGFPDFAGVESTFPARETRPDGVVVVTEVCYFPDGGTSEQQVQTWRTPSGWRVLMPAE